MNREKIVVKELLGYVDYIDDSETVKWIDDKQKNFDAEKGFIDIEVIVQRISDNKYFKFTYTKYGHNGNSLDSAIATEVFPVTKTVIIYE